VPTKIVPPDVSSILPSPFEWCEIPAGPVTIEYSETDHKTFDVPTFWMAKYPITNAQYQVFVDAEGGYRDPAWWGFSDEAKLWRRERESKEPKKTWFVGDNLPRTNITWYEALAFCQWLTQSAAQVKSGFNAALLSSVLITLPTEGQWQRPAQGDDGRIYPWGNEFDMRHCNTREAQIKAATSVTRYASGVSPFGVMDMSGNVWEKCLDGWESRKVDLAGKKARVLRGGSWSSNQDLAHINYRFKFVPDVSDSSQGFRIVATSFAE
jgi:formylglycine-generating enzyme required for sulfatase activity